MATLDLQTKLKSIGLEFDEIRKEIDDISSNHDYKLDIVGDKLDEFEGRLKHLEDEFLASRNGSLLWRIKNFNQVYDDAKTGTTRCIFSNFIHTGIHGYKLQVILYPNGVGIGENKYVSVYIVLHKTDHDILLPWPFKQKVKIKLVDMNESSEKRQPIVEIVGSNRESSSFMRPIYDTNPGWGFPKFVSHEDLGSRPFVRENCLFLKIQVEPYDIVDINKISFD